MSLLARNLRSVVVRSPRILCNNARKIQTSGAASGGDHYSELTDYDLFLWDRPDAFAHGAYPHLQHWWEIGNNQSEFDQYYKAMVYGLAIAWLLGWATMRIPDDDRNVLCEIAEERIANGILVDLFPDQKEALLYVNNRETFPEHNPHTYDPTVIRNYFWAQ